MTPSPDFLADMRAELARLEALIAEAEPETARLRRAIAAMEGPAVPTTRRGRATKIPKPGTIARLILDRVIAAGESGIHRYDLISALREGGLTQHSSEHPEDSIRSNMQRLADAGFVQRVAPGHYVATISLDETA
jgi:hypothetical protein